MRRLAPPAAKHTFGRRSDRRRNAEASMEAIVSSNHRRRMKGAVPTVAGALLNRAFM
jgi:hypothetical protein